MRSKKSSKKNSANVPNLAALAPAFAGLSNVYVVGGAVRDRLLGQPTDDIDLILPNDPITLAKKIATRLNGSAFPLDEERGIVRIALENGVHIDIAKFQGSSLDADLDRRDFTINALAVPFEKWHSPNWKFFLLDRHHGVQDLKRKQLIPLSPSIFKEDPLRLFRVFRIAAQLKLKIPAPTLKLVSKYRSLIHQPAPERKRAELLQLFATDDATTSLVLMEKCGLLEEFFPEAKRLRRAAPVYYGKGGVLKHTLDSVKCFEEIVQDKSWFPGTNQKIAAYLAQPIAGHPRIAHCKWGLLLHDIGKPDTMKKIDGRLRFFEHEHVGADKVPSIASRFRWSSDEASRYEKFVRHHMRPGNLATHSMVSDKAIHRFFRDLGDDAVAMLLVSLGDHLTYLSPAQRRKRNSPHEKLTIRMVRRYYLHHDKVIPPKLVTGHDVMNTLHIPPSPLVGDLLADLAEKQTEGEITNKEQALKYLQERLSWHQQKRIEAKAAS